MIFNFTPTTIPSNASAARFWSQVFCFPSISMVFWNTSRKFKSPNASTDAERKVHRRPKLLAARIRPQSTVIARRSTHQDCCTHQTKPVQRSDGILDRHGCKSKRAHNSCFVSPYKSSRPATALPGQLSYYSEAYQKCLPVPPVFKRQPWVIRVRAYKNGTISAPVRVAASTMRMLLLQCTVKLNLNMAARRVFLEDGTEALEPKDMPHDSDVYISSGEPFLDPCKRIKEHLLLMENVTWSMDGLVLPIDAKRGKTKPALSKRMKELSRKPESGMLVFRNGTGEDGCEIFEAQNGMQKKK
ncbi:doublecortin domain-containing protein 1 isoform X2 [Ambystoma mexicanum]|uniref:doublecortin domain-containing protein 1 isoform X2 n=1 Tax=Ambystoma mexicanum TaxID=8296 RepID=UPI0037E950DC